MYSIYADGECFYNDTFALDEMTLIDPKLVLEDSAAGSLTFKLPKSNIAYSSINRLTTDISVYKNGQEIWEGRVLSETTDFWENRELYCEGALAFFNDTTQPQAQYDHISIRAFLEKVVEIHNSKVKPNRAFRIGAVTVVDEDESVIFLTDYQKTMEVLNDLVETYGGHLRVRKQDGVRYLDYLKDSPKTCSQLIQFGSNLMDYTRSWDSTEYATVILPLGARQSTGEIDSLESYLTVESVNDGSPYVQLSEAVACYGWIEKIVNFDDDETAEALMESAKKYLSDLQFDNLVLEVSAVDLHYMSVDYEPIELLDEIRVLSRPHGLDRLFTVSKLEIPLDSPENTEFTLGDEVSTSLTEVNNQNSESILKKIDNLPKSHKILKEAKDNATEIMKMATTGFITITQDKYGSETLYISSERDYTKSERLWKWNMNGLGYSNDGGKTYGLAITMDGSIVADYITTGVLNADVIRAGVLKDVGDNFMLNLDTGELIIKKGSIDIGDGNFVVTDEGVVTAQLLYAHGGEIAGFTIKPEYMHTGGGNYYVAINGSDTNAEKEYAFWAGNPDPEKAKFWVKKTGEMYSASGVFNGRLEAATGNFVGVVQAADFLDSNGKSMMITTDTFSADYLDLHGMTITDKSTGLTSFAVSEDGKVTINGNITMGAGCSIDWNLVENENIKNNPAYILAQDAKKSIPSYIKKTYIDATTIESPVVKGGTFYGETFNVIAENTQGSFNLYGSYDSNQHHMLAIEYHEYQSPTVDIYSPASAQINIGDSEYGGRLSFYGSVIEFNKSPVSNCKVDFTGVTSIDFTGVKIIGLET